MLFGQYQVMQPLGSSFSTGMKQRARLAQALVGDPKLLLLDEPTSGLDPRGRDEMLQLIADIPGRTGASVVLSTHILPDVEQTCDQVVVLAEGQVRYAGALEPMLRAGERTYEVRTKGDPGGLRRALEREGCVITQTGATLEVRLPEGVPASQILAAAVQTGAQVRHLAPLHVDLEPDEARAAHFEALFDDVAMGAAGRLGGRGVG